MIFCKKAGWGMALLFLCLIFGTGRTQKIEAAVQNVPEGLEEELRLDTVGTDQETERAAVREKKGQQEKEAGDTETDQAAAQDELLAELDFDAIQQEVDSLLSSQQFSFAGTVRSLLQDGDPFRTFRAGNAVLSCAKTAFLAQKGLMKELFLLVLAGAVLAFARALGEYGATSMIAGYTPGKTATVSTTVYQLWQINNDALALKWVLINIAISAVILLIVNMLEKKNLLAAGRGRRGAA